MIFFLILYKNIFGIILDRWWLKFYNFIKWIFLFFIWGEKWNENLWLVNMLNEWFYNEYFNKSVDMKCDVSCDGYKVK